jgi:hypothetical protein
MTLARTERRALVVGVAGLVAVVVGAFFDAGAFYRAWLASWLFWLSVALGPLVIVMLHYLSGGAWGIVLRRIAESAIATLPVVAILFVPLAFGLPNLYLWARPDAVAADPTLQHKHVYLNVPFFLVRAALYFVAWIGVSTLLVRWSRRRDVAPDPHPRRFRLLAGPGLIVYGVTITLAAIDWGMSIDTHWYSTVYPMMFGVGQVVAGFAFTIVVAVLLRTRDPYGRLVNAATLNDLGNLLLTFVVLWAYCSFSQFILIFAGNIREEVTWYLARERPGWLGVALVLIAVHFFVPFFLLLSRAVKRNPVTLAGVAVLILVMRLLDDYWLVVPGVPDAHGFHWLYVVTPVALGGIWIAAFARQLGALELVPRNDPLVEQAMAQAMTHGR